MRHAVTVAIGYKVGAVVFFWAALSAASRFSPEGDPSPVQASHPGAAENEPFEPCVMSRNAFVEVASP